MASPPTADDYEHIVTAAEAASHFSRNPLSPAVDFDDLDDLIFHHLEEAQAADNLLKAAETEYRPPRALSPTEYYDNVRSWKTMDSSKMQYHVSIWESSPALPGVNPTVGEKPPATGIENPFAKSETQQNNSVIQMPTETRVIRLDQDRGSSSSTAVFGEQVLGPVEEDFASLIELTIADDGKKVAVHEYLLCEVSKFFAARRAAGRYVPSSSRYALCIHNLVMMKYLRGSKTRTPGSSIKQRMSYPLRDYSPSIEWDSLLVFFNWIYFNKLYDKVFDDIEDEDHPSPSQWNALLDLYFLAVKWEILVLKNLLLDVMIKTFRICVFGNEEFPCDYTKSIYRHTDSGDPLRLLWVEFYMAGIGEVEYENEIKSNELDITFVKDLSVSFINGGIDKDNPPFLTDPTEYHVPDLQTGLCCCRTRFEGDDYEHKCEFMSRDTNHIEAAHGRIRGLESELKKGTWSVFGSFVAAG